MSRKWWKPFISPRLVTPLLILGLFLVLAACGDAPSVHYEVKAGDTLDSIAEMFNTTPLAIEQISNLPAGTVISEGQTLTIPAPGCNLGATYVVKMGDTLASIASEHNTTVQALMAANDLRNINRILTGQCLIMPGPPTPTPAPTTPPPPSPTICQHTFKQSSGDSLDNLAQRYGVRKQAVMEENHLPTENALIDHQMLVITLPRQANGDPGNCVSGDQTIQQGTFGLPPATPASTKAPAVPTVTQFSGDTYIVQRGDTLYSIARRYGLDVSTLAKANNLADPNKIKTGQQLKIPKKS